MVFHQLSKQTGGAVPLLQERNPMTTQTAAGWSAHAQTHTASREAVAMARETLNSEAQVGLLFVGPQHRLVDVLDAARSTAPNTQFIACHTAGEIVGDMLRHGSVACLLLGSDRAQFLLRSAHGGEDPVTQLADGFKDAYQQATRRGLGYSTTTVLVNNFAVRSEPLVKDLRAATRAFQQIVGGVAGDEGAFKSSAVMSSAQSEPGTAAVIHAFDSANWGIGVEHGMTAASKSFTVTRAKENRLFELDGRPAFEVYREFAQQHGVTLEPRSSGPFLLQHSLGVSLFGQITHARTPFLVGKAGELILVGGIVEGAQVSILNGETDALVAAAGAAAEEAKKNLQGARAAGVLTFDCYCRGALLGEQFPRSLAAIRKVFPTEPLVGFLTYGEIARFSGRLDGFHNATSVVAAIPA